MSDLDRLLDALAEALAKRLAARLSQPGRAPASPANGDYESETELSTRCGISARTLQGWRLKGNGPPFVRAGKRVLYPRHSTDKWFFRAGESH
jgi:hypothetical protein